MAVVHKATVRKEHGLPPYLEDDWEEWECALSNLRLEMERKILEAENLKTRIQLFRLGLMLRAALCRQLVQR